MKAGCALQRKSRANDRLGSISDVDRDKWHVCLDLESGLKVGHHSTSALCQTETFVGAKKGRLATAFRALPFRPLSSFSSLQKPTASAQTDNSPRPAPG